MNNVRLTKVQIDFLKQIAVAKRGVFAVKEYSPRVRLLEHGLITVNDFDTLHITNEGLAWLKRNVPLDKAD